MAHSSTTLRLVHAAPKPVVRDVLPLFRWEEPAEPAHPFALRRSPAPRIYLDRPWFNSGDGELLGVILAFGNDAIVAEEVRQWAADPVFLQEGPASRAVLRSAISCVSPGSMRTLVDRLGARLPAGVLARPRPVVRRNRPRPRHGVLAVRTPRGGPVPAELACRTAPFASGQVRFRAAAAEPHRLSL